MDDWPQVRQYVLDGSEAAFTALVNRHLDLVYSTALRRLGNAHAAQEVAQSVFCLLAEKARLITPHGSLVGWLYRMTCWKASEYRRAEGRRGAREKEFAMMQDEAVLPEDEAKEAWKEIAPLLEEAMQALPERDRVAILLRFFQRKPLREVGLSLGLAEDAAGKRVNRGIERLRQWFHRKGVAFPAAALAAVLSAQAVEAAPAGSAVHIAKAAWGLAIEPSSVSITTYLLLLMTNSKLTMGVAVALALLLTVSTGLFIYNRVTDSHSPTQTTKPVNMPRSSTNAFNASVLQRPGARGLLTAAQPVADPAFTNALARLREALYGPAQLKPVPADKAALGMVANPYEAVTEAMMAIPFEQRGATLLLLLEALKDPQREVVMRAINALGCTGSAGEPAMPALWDILKNKTGEWPSAADNVIFALVNIHPQSDLVPDLVSAFADGPKATREALATQMPLLKSMIENGSSAFAASLQPLLSSPDAELRFYTARSLAQLPGPKDPAVTRELAAVIERASGSQQALERARTAIGALWGMGEEARESVPVLRQVMEQTPELRDAALLAIKAILPNALRGYPVPTQLPPMDEPAKALLQSLHEGTVSVPTVVAAPRSNDPQAAMTAARALAELGTAAADSLPAMRQSFDAVLATNAAAGMVLAAAIERIDPGAPKLLLNLTDWKPALEAVQKEVMTGAYGEPETVYKEAGKWFKKNMGLLRPEDLRAVAEELGKVNPKLQDIFITQLVATDSRLKSALQSKP